MITKLASSIWLAYKNGIFFLIATKNWIEWNRRAQQCDDI